jgi:hypothetical protein
MRNSFARMIARNLTILAEQTIVKVESVNQTIIIVTPTIQEPTKRIHLTLRLSVLTISMNSQNRSKMDPTQWHLLNQNAEKV